MSREGYAVNVISDVMMVGSIVGLLLPLFGILSDMWSRNKLIRLALISNALGYFFYPFNLFLGRATNVLGNIILEPQFRPILVELSKRKNLGAIMASLILVTTLPTIFAPYLAGLVADTFGFNVLFYLCGVLCLFALLLVPKFESKPKDFKFKFDMNVHPGLLLLSAIVILFGVTDGIRAILYPLVFTDEYGLSASTTGMLIGIAAIGYITTLLYFKDKFDLHHPRKLLSVALTLGVILSFLQYIALDLIWFMIVIFIGSAVYSMIIPTVDKLIAQNSRNSNLAFDMSIPGLGYGVGFLIGNFFATLVNAVWGLRGTFLATGVNTFLELALLVGFFHLIERRN